MIRVMIVDDQTLVREGLRALLALSPAVEVAGEAIDGEEALRRIPEVRPDVLLLDVRMPKLGGLDVLRRLAAAETPCPTILLTTFDDADALYEGLRLGARAYLLKDVSLNQLVQTIEAVAAGENRIYAAINALAPAGLGSAASADEPKAEPLTPRESDVLGLLSAGFSNREIGDVMRVSEGTVKNHVSNILSKLGARDRTAAVLRAAKLGML